MGETQTMSPGRLQVILDIERVKAEDARLAAEEMAANERWKNLIAEARQEVDDRIDALIAENIRLKLENRRLTADLSAAAVKLLSRSA